MDILGLGLIQISDWLLLIIAVGFAAFYYFTWNFKVWESQGVPGPKPRPFVGTALPFFKDPWNFDLNLIKKYGKIVGTFEGRRPVLVVADAEFLKHVLVKDFHAFESRREFHTGSFFDRSLFVASGQYWKMLRNLLSPTFSTGKIKAMMLDINECSKLFVENLEKEAKAERAFDIREYSGSFALDSIARVAFGILIDTQKDKDNEFHTTVKKMYGITEDVNTPIGITFTLYPFLNKILANMGYGWPPQEVKDFISKVVPQALEMSEKDDDGRKNFIKSMSVAHKLKSDDTGKRALTMDELLGQAILFFDAGFDTTANTLTWFIYSLACNPDIQEKVYAEIMEVVGDQDAVEYDHLGKLPFMEACFQESLRLYPAQRMDRKVSQDITVRGIHLPKDSLVVFSPYAIHRLEEYYEDPETFKPERFVEKPVGYLESCTFLPFGGGPRSCIGNRLALAELKVAIIQLVRKFVFKTCNRTKIPPEVGTGFVFKEKDGTWLKAELR